MYSTIRHKELGNQVNIPVALTPILLRFGLIEVGEHLRMKHLA